MADVTISGAGLLAGKAVLVTGASGGIGSAVALIAAREGATVGLGYHRQAEAAGALARRCAQLHGARTVLLPADLSQPGAAALCVERFVAEVGRLDGLVLCAAVSRPALLAIAEDADVEELLAVNLKAPIDGVRAALPTFLSRRSGVIVAVSSVSAVRPSSGHTVYAATKGALEAFVRAVAVEYGRKGIRAHTVRPGPIDTAMLEGIHAQLGDVLERSLPLRRLGRPEEVGELIVFLLSDRAGFATGGVHVIDGGYSIAGVAGATGGGDGHG